MAQDSGKIWRQNGNDWDLENADLQILPWENTKKNRVHLPTSESVVLW